MAGARDLAKEAAGAKLNNVPRHVTKMMANKVLELELAEKTDPLRVFARLRR
jgi:hypothetical protein